jgi:hypothetical protein
MTLNLAITSQMEIFTLNHFIKSKKHGKKKIKLDKAFKWIIKLYYRTYNATSGYIQCKLKSDPKSSTVPLQHLIMQPPKGMVADHIDPNKKWDYRRSNLQVITQQENLQKKLKGTTYAGKSTSSQYKGVSLVKGSMKWHASIRYADMLLGLGDYQTEKLAAIAYNVYATLLFGQFARINEIEISEAELSQINFAKRNAYIFKKLEKHGKLEEAQKFLEKL